MRGFCALSRSTISPVPSGELSSTISIWISGDCFSTSEINCSMFSASLYVGVTTSTFGMYLSTIGLEFDPRPQGAVTIGGILARGHVLKKTILNNARQEQIGHRFPDSFQPELV